MDDHMSAPFCLGDALWKAMPPQADRPGQRHDAAIRPTACVAACCWRGPQASARARRPPPGALPPLVRQSRGRRRRHRMQALGLLLCAVGGQPWQTRHPAARSVMERFPRAGGDQRRLRRATRAAAETLRGAPARPHRSVSGLTMPRLGPPDGQPVAWCLPPGGWGDVEALPDEAEALPEGARRDAEKADKDSDSEERLPAGQQRPRRPRRPQHSKRAGPPSRAVGQSDQRQRVATAGSRIDQLWPQAMHAVTSQGLARQVALFGIATRLHCYLNLEDSCREQLRLLVSASLGPHRRRADGDRLRRDQAIAGGMSCRASTGLH